MTKTARRLYRRVFLFFILGMYLGINWMYPLDPGKQIAAYVHETWGTGEGLPQNSVLAITQGKGGYLWLGTQEGLVRFDGITFKAYDKGNVPQFKYNWIRALCRDKKDNLWLGIYRGGVVRLSWKHKTFTAFTHQNTRPSGDGSRPGGAEHSEGGRVANSADTGAWAENILIDGTKKGELVNGKVAAIYEDGDGRLWIGTDNCLVVMGPKDGHFTEYGAAHGFHGNRVRCFCEDRRGNMWIGTWGGGLTCLNEGKFTTFTQRHGLSNDRVWCIMEDRHAKLWVGTENGLNLMDPETKTFTKYTTRHGLADNRIFTLYEDRDGCVWVGTRSGLSRLNPAARQEAAATVEGNTATDTFHSFTPKDGLSGSIVKSIFQDREGSLWVGTYIGGLNRFREGKLITYAPKNNAGRFDAVFESHKGKLWFGSGDGLYTIAPDTTELKKYTSVGVSDPVKISELCGTGDGTLWIGTKNSGLFRLDPENKEISHVHLAGQLTGDAIDSLCEDREGNLWIGAWGKIFRRDRDGTFSVFSSQLELTNSRIRDIFEDRDGKLWVGTDDGLLQIDKNTRDITYHTSRDGLSNDFIKHIFQDRAGDTWISTVDGLNLMREGKFFPITIKDGLFSENIHRILEDGTGNFWMSCNKGIFRTAKKELLDFCNGKTATVNCIAYNEKNGMKSRECNGSGQSSGWKSRDGKLWFSTVKGIVMIDPNNIALNPLPPPVVVEEIIVDNKIIETLFSKENKKIILPPGTERLEIRYSGLSLQLPSKVRFKYKLEGFDTKWNDVSRRIAYYTKIPAGPYTFRVTACNNDGVWNTSGVAVSFYQEPLFYQAWWFYILCVLATGSIAFLFYHLRLST
ncbi:MAG: hypothetical protein GY765_29915, partial [bacterium]|nr:hypothetical protein [bacterium]